MLLFCAEQGWQSDAQFCENYIAYRKRQGQGPAKIQQELRKKGLSGEVIHEYLSPGASDWLMLAREVSEIKYGCSPPEDAKEKAKRARFLFSRGFSHAVISDVTGG